MSSDNKALDPVKAALSKQINDLHGMLEFAEMNGLFDGKNHELNVKLKKDLDAANTSISATPPDINSTWDHVHDFYADYRKAEQQRGWWWRFSIKYAFPSWLYLAISPFALYWLQGLYLTQLSTTLRDAFLWGMLGGVAQGFYWVYQSVDHKAFQDNWMFWVLSLPIAGAIFGGITYLLVVGGLIPLLTGASTSTNGYFVLLLAALAGFNWKNAVSAMSTAWAKATKASTS